VTPHPANSIASGSRSDVREPRTPLLRRHEPGLSLTFVEAGGARELHLTLTPLPAETPGGAARRLARALSEAGAVVFRQEVFATLPACRELMEEMSRCFGRIDWPVTCVEGAGCARQPWAGLNVLAIAGTKVETITHHKRIVGRSYQDKWARYVALGDLRPENTALSRPEQAGQLYEAMAAVLQQTGLTMRHVVRTWIFLEDILAWYGPFNDVRTRFYREHGVFEGLVPASTGVGGRNLAGAAVVAGALAVEPLNGAFSAREVASPKQCPAPCYGSSFSRAVELASPHVKRVLVSGTASIEPGGTSVCGGDVEAQIDLTLEVVRAILVSRGLDLAEASRAIAYFKRAEDAHYLQGWQARHQLENWPVLYAQDTICRGELLFEIEVDALGGLGPGAKA
jgi:enamine deaminase RidA (YjgF/YER057c/UK114 family)